MPRTIGDRRLEACSTPQWLEKARAELALRFDCAPGEVESHLEARAKMNAYIAERKEYLGGQL